MVVMKDRLIRIWGVAFEDRTRKEEKEGCAVVITVQGGLGIAFQVLWTIPLFLAF